MERLARLISTTALLAVVVANADEPYKRMLDDTLVFTGTETQSPETDSAGEIVIGLFAPDNEEDLVGRAMTRGATLAVDQANATGGIDGRPIRLIRRWADDPWGAGSKEVIRLVFEDNSWAIIGGPDGASTHVAQQVATKAHIPLIAPVSTDPSLTHTGVPWIFRLPPDDVAQARVLVRDGVVTRGLERVGLVTATDHDSRTAAVELAAALEEAGAIPVFHLELSGPADLGGVARRIVAFQPDGLVVRLPVADLRRLASSLGEEGLDCALMTPWVPGMDLRRFPLAYPGPVVSVMPFEKPERCGSHLKLIRAYIAHWGEAPTPAAVYGFDAVGLLIQAMGGSVTGRIELRQTLAGLSPTSGASGPIDWDTGGGNTATPVLVGSAPHP